MHSLVQQFKSRGDAPLNSALVFLHMCKGKEEDTQNNIYAVKIKKDVVYSRVLHTIFLRWFFLRVVPSCALQMIYLRTQTKIHLIKNKTLYIL